MTARNARVALDAIAKPRTEWDRRARHVQGRRWRTRRQVTGRIGDHRFSARSSSRTTPRTTFLQWFIAEQVEGGAERPATWCRKFAMAGEHPAGLYRLDKELTARVYNIPSPLAAGA